MYYKKITNKRINIETHSEEFEKQVLNYLKFLFPENYSHQNNLRVISEMRRLLKREDIHRICVNDIAQILIRLFSKLYFPELTTIELLVTESCNLKCDYCFVRKKRFKNMTFEIGQKAIEFFFNQSENSHDLEISFMGGEPLLNFAIIEKIIRYIENRNGDSGKNVGYSLTTNGTLLNDNIISFAKDRMKFLLSIDGDEETHNKHRKTISGEGSFHLIINNIEKLKQSQRWLGSRITVYPDTVKNLKYNISYLFDLGINQFIVGPSFGAPWSRDSLNLLEEQLKALACFYAKMKKENASIRIRFLDEPINKNSNNNIFGCQAARNGISISSDGFFYPCSMTFGLGGPYLQKYCLGNINDGWTRFDLRDEFVQKSGQKFPFCNDCERFDFCKGFCPAHLFFENDFSINNISCTISRIFSRVNKYYHELN